jgi:hypothetical protein
MSKYTVELGDIAKSGLKIFNFPYEFYDEEKRTDFEKKFIEHFYFREIGQETVGRFQHYLKCKCNETLPYYNMLFRTALIDYEKTINYKLTETYNRGVNKTDSVIGSASNDGTNTNTLNRSLDNTTVGNKTNTLDSTTKHTEDNTTTHTENITESGDLNKSSTLTIDGRKVGSDTPNGLLSMENIKGNVYANKADIEDTTNTTNDFQSTSEEKTNTTTDNIDNSVKDEVDATSTDHSTDTINEDVHETNNGSFETSTSTTQNTTGSENETSTHTTMGSYGVITEADMLQKHINLQQTLSKILSMFFDECEDLFMGVF